jgi:tetraacyldisaccharide 4'-kinase
MSDETGDEPKWLKSKHSQAQILVSRNRAVDAQEIKDADIFILDDGRQHIRLHRNFEITLLDTTRDFCSYKMFPEGMAREPWKNLKCSDLIILTRSNLVDLQKIRQLKAEISRTGFDGPIIQSSLHVKELKKLRAGQNNVACEVFLISGIGNPKSFETLVRLTYPQFIIKGIKEFPDHVGYTTQGLLSAMSDALKAGASSIVITEKDAVKWIEIMSDIDGTKIDGPKIDIFVLETFLVFEPNLPDIYDLAINKNH